jgi:hypothetical protein
MSRNIGRLCEIRYGALELGEMSLYRTRFTSMLQDAPHGKLVFVSDVRGCNSVSAQVEEQGVSLMRAVTPRIERAAMLVSPRTIFGMQLLRATMLTDSHVRRVFNNTTELEQWLHDVLDVAERYRLREFLNESSLATETRR